MRAMTKRAVAVAAAGGAYALTPRGRRALRHGAESVDRRLRYAGGRLTGAGYRLRGGHPADGVDDATLADRVRARLGPVTKRLDLPHVHVMAESGVVILHGDVGRASDAVAVEHAALNVHGVQGVESYLHIGLLPGDTRPSAGAAQPSRLLSALRGAAAATVGADRADPLVTATLAAFAERLPEGERRHVTSHLPADVAWRFAPPRRCGKPHPARDVRAFADRVAATAGDVPYDDALVVATAVLRELRAAVPDEAADVYAVLPAELHALWPARA